MPQEAKTNKAEKPSGQAEVDQLKEKVKQLEAELKAKPPETEKEEPALETPVAPERVPRMEDESPSSLVTPINFAQMDDDTDEDQQDDAQATLKSSVPADDLEAQVQTLVKLALTSGISQAVDNAKRLNNAYVMDELHDTLVDHLYDQLVRMKRIEKD